MRPRGMLRATAVAAGVVLAACGTGQQRATGGGAPQVGAATQVSGIQIDASQVTALSVPVNVTMKPIARVGYAQVEKGPTTPNFQFVTVGSTWFDRTSDGFLARHVQVDSIRIENVKTQQIGTAPVRASVTYQFKPDGTIWLMNAEGTDFPTQNPTKGINDKAWAELRAHLMDSFDMAAPWVAFRCAFEPTGLTRQNIQTGSPIGPQSRAEVLDRFLDCTFAAVRGGAPIYDDAARAELMAASPARIAELKKEAAAGFSDWFNAIVDAGSSIKVKGSVIEDGREFLFADGDVTMAFAVEGKKFAIVSHQQLLIDPYTGLVYKAKTKSTTTGDDDPELAALKVMDGSEYSYSADIPQQVPAVVAIAQPAPIVTAAGSPGSLADLYSRSVNAVFLVAAPEADGVSLGTGFAVSPSDIITAAHVVGTQKSVMVLAPDGNKTTATVIAADPKRDVALLRAQGSPFKGWLKLAPDFPVTGSQIAVIGCPVDPSLCGTLTTGVVSFSVRPIDGVNHVQIDAVINKGNSGGPILNLAGQVIGIAVFKITADETTEGLSFGLSSTEVSTFLREHQLTVDLGVQDGVL